MQETEMLLQEKWLNGREDKFMTLILDGVQKKYKHFDLDIGMEVQTGFVTGLIGKNGAGKSTTFKTILGLTRPERGMITLDGKDVSKLTAKERQNIGVVLTDSGFSGYMTIRDIAAVMAAMYDAFDKENFLRQCEQFDLPLNQKIKEFSMGMRVKLKTLLAMSHDAKFLLLDEPTTGLDVVAREEILDMLREYMKQGDRSILISSHISSDLEGLCDDIYLCDDGRIVLHEETDTLLDNYGVLKLREEQYQGLDTAHILAVKEGKYGYECLTDNKAYYLKKYPDYLVEKGSIDEVLTMMIRRDKGGK